MGRPPLKIDVTKKDQQELRSLLKGGVQQVRVVLRALALLQLAEDVSAPQIAKAIPLTPQAIRRLGHRYQTAGLEGALYEKQRPGAAEVLDNNQRQRIIAMVCAGINRHGAEDEGALRERSSDPLGPEFCTGRCKVSSEA